MPDLIRSLLPKRLLVKYLEWSHLNLLKISPSRVFQNLSIYIKSLHISHLFREKRGQKGDILYCSLPKPRCGFVSVEKLTEIRRL